jgi:hypothetical protein
MYYNPNWLIPSIFFPFFLSPLFMVISTDLQFLYLFLYRKYIHFHLLNFLLRLFLRKGLHFLPMRPWTTILLFMLLCSWDDRHVPPCPPIGWDGVFRTFCPNWPWNAILLISASQVARITGVSHQCLTYKYIFECIFVHKSKSLPLSCYLIIEIGFVGKVLRDLGLKLHLGG